MYDLLNLIEIYLNDLGCKVEIINSYPTNRLRTRAKSKEQAFTIASSLNRKFAYCDIRSSLLQPDSKSEMYHMQIDSIIVAIYFPVDDHKKYIPKLTRRISDIKNFKRSQDLVDNMLSSASGNVKSEKYDFTRSNIGTSQMSYKELATFADDVDGINSSMQVGFRFDLSLWYYLGFFIWVIISSYELRNDQPLFFQYEYIFFGLIYLFLPHIIKYKDELKVERDYLNNILPGLLRRYSGKVPEEYLIELKNFRRTNKKMVKVGEFINKIRREQSLEESRREYAERVAKETGDYWWKNQRGREFEINLSVLLSRLGAQIMRTPVSGDGGVDLFATWADLGTLVIQCKGWNAKVGVATARELVGVLHSLNAQKSGVKYVGVLAAPNGVTQPAASFSIANSVLIWSADQLVDLANEGGEQLISEYFDQSL